MIRFRIRHRVYNKYIEWRSKQLNNHLLHRWILFAVGRKLAVVVDRSLVVGRTPAGRSLVGHTPVVAGSPVDSLVEGSLVVDNPAEGSFAAADIHLDCNSDRIAVSADNLLVVVQEDCRSHSGHLEKILREKVEGH